MSQPLQKMKIGLAPGKTHLHVACPFVFNDAVQSFPDRSFMKVSKMWEVPLLAANIRYWEARLKNHPLVITTKEASDAIELAKSKWVKLTTKDPFPSNYPFKIKPWAFQATALDEAWSLHVVLFDFDMGTGKSMLSLAKMCANYLNGRIKACIIITPINTKYNWEAEIHKHTPKECSVRVNSPGPATDLVKWFNSGSGFPVIVVGFESISGETKVKLELVRLVSQIGPYGVICDEAHFIKNPDALRSKAATEIAQDAVLKIAMTGTPISNSAIDLFGIFCFLDRNIIGVGSTVAFKSRYHVVDTGFSKRLIGYKNLTELAELTKPYILRASKSESLPDLPERTWAVRRVPMTQAQKQMYTDLRGGVKSMAEDLTPKEVMEALVALTRMSQVSEGFIGGKDEDDNVTVEWIVDPAKAPKTVECLETLDLIGDKPVVIWTRFTPSLLSLFDILRSKFGNDAVVPYYGGISPTERESNRVKFITGKAQIFLANPVCGGTGLNGLTVASDVIYMNNSWSLVDRLQSLDRVHRPGQTKPVLYIDLVCMGSLDPVVLNAISNKQDVLEYIRVALAAGRDPFDIDSQS